MVEAIYIKILRQNSYVNFLFCSIIDEILRTSINSISLFMRKFNFKIYKYRIKKKNIKNESFPSYDNKCKIYAIVKIKIKH